MDADDYQLLRFWLMELPLAYCWQFVLAWAARSLINHNLFSMLAVVSARCFGEGVEDADGVNPKFTAAPCRRTQSLADLFMPTPWARIPATLLASHIGAAL